MELNLLYVHGSSIGYGRYGVELAAALDRMKVDVYDHLPGTTKGDHLDDSHLNQGYQSKICNTVCWVSVPSHARGWYEGQNAVAATMWESSELPESFRETMHNFSTIIVPSKQNLELFSRYHDNVKFVPLGIDPIKWAYKERKPPEATFNFLIGGSGTRKGTDLAHQAFRKVFGRDGSWGDGPVPQLIMKNPRGENFYGDRVQLVSGRISDQDEVDLYANAHCYLQPSRGEGFGLQPLQAIAQGCPTILTAAHGHDAFAHLGYGLSTTMEDSAYFIYGDAGKWWEPSLPELCEYMEYVYYEYDKATEFAKASSETALREFTWDKCAEGFVAAIGEEELTKEFDGSEWFEPDVKKFLIITNRDWRADIAGVNYHFKKGQSYYELADVKRILFEGNILDPACLGSIGPGGETDMDCGLTDSQIALIPEYTAANESCMMCGHKLEGKTRADLIFEELEAARA